MLGKLLRLFSGEDAANQGSASIFERDGLLYVHPDDETVSGIRRFAEPVLITSRDRLDELSAHLRAALAASKAGVPDRRGSTADLRPLLAAAGVRSYKSFAEGTKLVGAQMTGGLVRLCPTKNLGPKEGWTFCEELAVTVDIASPEAAGALLAALDASIS